MLFSVISKTLLFWWGVFYRRYSQRIFTFADRPNFSIGVKLVWIQSFPFPRLFSWPNLKNSVCYLSVVRESRWMSLPTIITVKVKHKQPHPGLELGSPIPFPMTITVTLQSILLNVVAHTIQIVFLILRSKTSGSGFVHTSMCLLAINERRPNICFFFLFSDPTW